MSKFISIARRILIYKLYTSLPMIMACRLHLKKLKTAKIAIIGSAGKTTTKEMIVALLKEKFKLNYSNASLNNPHHNIKLVFSTKAEVEYSIFEVGISKIGEMARHAMYLEPDIAVFTNIADCHLKGLKSKEFIISEKTKILDKVKENGVVIINRDDEFLAGIKPTARYEIVDYGIDNRSCYQARNLRNLGLEGCSFDLYERGKLVDAISLRLLGRHNIYNALASIAVARRLNIDIKIIRGILENLKSLESRMCLKNISGISVIDDTVAASPCSYSSAFETLKGFQGGRLILVLGGMQWLGNKDKDYHLSVGRQISADWADSVLTYGRSAKGIFEGCLANGFPKDKVLHLNQPDDIFNQLAGTLRPGDIVFFQGSSRDMRIGAVIKRLISYLSDNG